MVGVHRRCTRRRVRLDPINGPAGSPLWPLAGPFAAPAGGEQLGTMDREGSIKLLSDPGRHPATARRELHRKARKREPLLRAALAAPWSNAPRTRLPWPPPYPRFQIEKTRCSRCSSLAVAPISLIRLLLASILTAHQIHPTFFFALGRPRVAGGPPCWPRISEVWPHSRPSELYVHAELREAELYDLTEPRIVEPHISPAKMRFIQSPVCRSVER
jgi:hypothetical protein